MCVCVRACACSQAGSLEGVGAGPKMPESGPKTWQVPVGSPFSDLSPPWV